MRAVTALCVAVLAFAVHLAYDAGELSWNRPHGLGRCALRFEKELVGVEDVAVDHQRGAAYLAHDDRYEPFHRGGYLPGDPAGGVWRYDFAADAAAPVALEGGPEALHPHGVDVRGDVLAVADHQPDGAEGVVLFRLDGDTGARARHTATVRHELMTGVNDVAVVPGGEAFYVTNWLRYRPGTLMGAVEKYGRRPWTNVLRCEAASGRCREVAAGLKMANGVTLSPDGQTLWVVESIGKQVREYDVLPGDGSLRERRALPTGGFLGDNLSFNPADGSLLLTAHPRGLTFVLYSARPRQAGGFFSPWSVLRLDAGADGFREVAYSLGETVSAASVAAEHGGRGLVGTVMDRGVLVCEGGFR